MKGKRNPIGFTKETARLFSQFAYYQAVNHLIIRVSSHFEPLVEFKKVHRDAPGCTRMHGCATSVLPVCVTSFED